MLPPVLSAQMHSKRPSPTRRSFALRSRQRSLSATVPGGPALQLSPVQLPRVSGGPGPPFGFLLPGWASPPSVNLSTDWTAPSPSFHPMKSGSWEGCGERAPGVPGAAEVGAEAGAEAGRGRAGAGRGQGGLRLPPCPLLGLSPTRTGNSASRALFLHMSGKRLLTRHWSFHPSHWDAGTRSFWTLRPPGSGKIS